MWDERYKSKEFLYGTEPNDFLKGHHAVIPKGEVLCLAEGEGRNAVFLAGLGYTVTAVDSSIVGLTKAKKLAQEKAVDLTCIHADLAQFDIEVGRWNAIVSIFCHVPTKLREALHKKVVAGLKPEGVFLLEAYTVKQLEHGTGGPPSEALMMSAEGLQKELEGLNFSHLTEIEREIREGTHHFGLGAVVQVIGTKN